MEPFSFSSLHEYLDCAFKDNPNPSWDEIKNAKKEYWKIYYKHYRREKRIKRKEFSLGFYPKQLQLIHQKRGDKSKVYSLHAPETSCIAKGKAHKKYEFGSKVSVASLSGSNVVVGISSYPGNPHDSKTLSSTLEQVKQYTGREYSRVLVDKGYRGHGDVGDREVIIPGKKHHASAYALRRHKRLCKRRSAIEAIIGHLKSDHKLCRNYLKGSIGERNNALLAGMGFNLLLILRG